MQLHHCSTSAALLLQFDPVVGRQLAYIQKKPDATNGRTWLFPEVLFKL
uniref:Uncharacterized protein n=1 Tax=Arundo donax TaxID=35708 RepID=A0A0A8Y1I7_ARUDO